MIFCHRFYRLTFYVDRAITALLPCISSIAASFYSFAGEPPDVGPSLFRSASDPELAFSCNYITGVSPGQLKQKLW